MSMSRKSLMDFLQNDVLLRVQTELTDVKLICTILFCRANNENEVYVVNADLITLIVRIFEK